MDSVENIFNGFHKLKDVKLKDKFSELRGVANTAVDKFHASLKSTLANQTDEASQSLKLLVDKHEAATQALRVAEQATGENAAVALGEARTAFANSKRELREVLGGARDLEVGTGDAKKLLKIPEALKKDFVEAADATAKVARPAGDRFTGILRTQGVEKAFQHNTENMKFWREELSAGKRGMAVMQGGALVGSAIMLGDAALRSKNAEGEDRSAATRLVEAVIGGAVGTAALLGGRVPAMAVR